MSAKDPTEAMRLRASQYPEVDEGTACTQSSFKAGKKAFLFIGEQGGRYKAMFKLDSSMKEAAGLAESDPEDYQVGNTAWVTARFCSDNPMPARRWKKWLDESYRLSIGGAKKKTASGKMGTKKNTKKKVAARKKARKKK
ncbi:MAG: MmcQ/YjbR family DNA-binding protein [Planctomycetota bacterium]